MTTIKPYLGHDLSHRRRDQRWMRFADAAPKLQASLAAQPAEPIKPAEYPNEAERGVDESLALIVAMLAALAIGLAATWLGVA